MPVIRGWVGRVFLCYSHRMKTDWNKFSIVRGWWGLRYHPRHLVVYGLGLLSLAFLMGSYRGLGAATSTISTWKGEFFTEKQGGFYVQILMGGFQPGQQQRFAAGTVQVSLVNLLTRDVYKFSPSPTDSGVPPKEIWKIQSGKYLIRSIEMVDSQGAIRRFKPKNLAEANHFLVKRSTISNLGLWQLSPVRDTGLSFRVSMIPNRYQEEGAKKESSVKGIIDGYTGDLQQEIAGVVPPGAQGGSGVGKKQLRAVVTTNRLVAFFYKLNLFKHNYYAKSMSETLTVYDGTLRQCLLDRMAQLDQDIRGQLVFTFILNKASGTLTKIKKSGGTVQDQDLIRCLSLKLQSIQFSPDASMLGELTYTFDVQ